MSTVYIAEYVRTGLGPRGKIPVAEDGPIAQQTVAITGASVQSAALNAATTFVRVHTDAICSVAFGANPTATTGNRRMAANTTDYFGIDQSTNTVKKIAVISNT